MKEFVNNRAAADTFVDDEYLFDLLETTENQEVIRYAFANIVCIFTINKLTFITLSGYWISCSS